MPSVFNSPSSGPQLIWTAVIPFHVAVGSDELALDFDPHVYLTKRALEYIVQEENERTGKKGSLRCTGNRIIYLAQHGEKFLHLVNGTFAEVANFFQLDRAIDVTQDASQISKSSSVRVTNGCYISLFDNSDEALLNDYEQILQLLAKGPDNPVAAGFIGLIDNFIQRNPEPVAGEVEDEWDRLSVPERLVDASPIPLNSEQRQILLALQKERCKYVTVEGPPGTGKSHTITAIVCDAVLRNQSILVLSDKKEALDVVEDKITATLNKVRTDQHFQNPILRLGKTGSTYAQILSVTVMQGIKAHYQAIKKQHDAVQETIDRGRASLKEEIEAEALAYADIDLGSVREWAALDGRHTGEKAALDLTEVLKQEGAADDLEDLRIFCADVKSIEDATDRSADMLRTLGFPQIGSIQDLVRITRAAAEIEALLTRVEGVFPEAASELQVLGRCTSRDLPTLTAFLGKFRALRKPLIAYLLTRRQAEQADAEFKEAFAYASAAPPHTCLATLARVLDISRLLVNGTDDLQSSVRGDWLTFCRLLLIQTEHRNTLRRLSDLGQKAAGVLHLEKQYPSTFRRVGLHLADWNTITSNRLATLESADFASLIRYVALTQELAENFRRIPTVNYAAEHSKIRDLVTAYMTFAMDGRVIGFYEHQKNTAKALRDIIRAKQQFPQQEFAKLREAFPCILAGIRDYAEYIPLEPEIFDLLIIDEASQVSIAQAFSALLRAKKILILGDKKQFSNVKAVQARSDTNRECLNRLEASFRRNVSEDPAKLVKLDRFNIRTSVLEFFEYISNFHTQLLKHFRAYKELIAYSNETFYRNTLQVMKIRAKSVDDVLRFTVLPESSAADRYRNVNQGEVDFILAELRSLKATGARLSVGIITPHTDQQKLLVDAVGRLPERRYFYDELKLKIMTFDTCQGEERDLVFYSMVASQASDRLWGVFIKDLASVDLEEDGKLKAQRLNVGFSRARNACTSS